MVTWVLLASGMAWDAAVEVAEVQQVGDSALLKLKPLRQGPSEGPWCVADPKKTKLLRAWLFPHPPWEAALAYCGVAHLECWVRASEEVTVVLRWETHRLVWEAP